ncbi:MAG TPA: GntG family PLP-dependent aldolase [Solirubrobacterales bacterium]|nr:GntG family PLP-dependent aldolase [Solirubrobacterales bacterium]
MGTTPVNLYSDTQTQPSAEMRRVMAEAPVGDEQRRLDPTVNELQERVAALLGQEAALFLPSGSMCNQIAIRLHTRPGGDELYTHQSAHPIVAEAGGLAAISGALANPLGGAGGIFSAADLEAALRDPSDRHQPRSRLVSVEQTTNMGGGRVWTEAQIGEVLAVAARHSLRTHLDGARLLNAVVASGVPAAAYAAGFDTAWIDFSKGLGAPVGACLAGSRETVEEAWRYKQMLGGAMRQAGIVAAGALWALDNNVERLAEDHANARLLAEGLAAIDGVELDPATVETNIVIFAVAEPAALVDALAAQGVEMVAFGSRVRAVTHLDVDRSGIERTVEVVADALG